MPEARSRGIEGPAISLRDVVKIYHPSPRWMRALLRSPISSPVTALSEVNVKVGTAEICAVIGPNGAGKTTMFRILTGLTTATNGYAEVLGHDPSSTAIEMRKAIGWMPAEDRSLLMRLTSAENLRFHGRLHGLDGADLNMRISRTLERVGLSGWEDASIFALSSGMKARLQLARSLLHRPQVLILDEPTASVDPVGSHELLELLMDLVKEEKLAVMISSHRLEEIEALQSRVVLLDRGEVLFHGDLGDLRRRWAGRIIDMTFTDREARDQAHGMLRSAGYHNLTFDGDTELQVSVDHEHPIGQVLAVIPGVVAHLLFVGERHIPLRRVLTDIYRRNRSTS